MACLNPGEEPYIIMSSEVDRLSPPSILSMLELCIGEIGEL